MKLFDAHSDVFLRCIKELEIGNPHYFSDEHLANLRVGGFAGAICAVYTPVEKVVEWDKFLYGELGRVSRVIRAIENRGSAVVACSYGEIEEAVARGVFFIVLGIEGLGGIGDDVDQIETLYRLGFREVLLTWNEANALATGVRGDSDRGLTKTGYQAIEKLEDLGMILDLSHLNDRSFWGAVSVARRPIVASHSNARALCDHPRNLTDEQVRAVADSGGVVGATAVAKFVHPENPCLEVFLDHVDHLVRVAGMDGVCFGLDYENYLDMEYDPEIDDGVRGISHLRQAGKILDGLIRRGYSENQIDKLAFDNMARVAREILG